MAYSFTITGNVAGFSVEIGALSSTDLNHREHGEHRGNHGRGDAARRPKIFAINGFDS
jgi:hypothetical protein